MQINNNENNNCYVIAGLGNPGSEYEKTRHNAGFMSVDYITNKLGGKFSKKKFQGRIWQGSISNKKIFTVKPETFMNLSGKCLNEVCSFYKISPKNTIVIYDDFALPVGTVRIRTDGSDAGHNGITSVITELGTRNFIRIRIGIGPLPSGESSINFVLSRFSKKEIEILENDVIPHVYEAVECIIEQGVTKAMNLYNKNFIEVPKEEPILRSKNKETNSLENN